MGPPAENALASLKRSLGEFARRTQAQTPGADGVGATVVLGDEPVFAGSNPFTDAVDELQYRLDEGPCVSAVADASEVRSSGVGADEQRWPAFTPGAATLALRSVASTPIVAGDEVIGSVNLYSRTPNGLDGIATPDLRRCAEAAQQALGGSRLVALAEDGARRLAKALRERTEVDFALGILMGLYTMNPRQADVLLGQLARQNGVSLAAAARSVISQETR